MQKILEYLKNNKITVIAVLIAVGFGVYYWQHKASAKTEVRYVQGAVQKTTITETVSGTGQIASSNQVDLKFGSNGTVTSVKVSQGQKIKAGDVIATLDESSAINQINQARAQVASAQANYDKLVAGLSSTDAQLAQLSVDSAQQALDKAKSDYDNTVKTQQQAVDTALRSLLNNDLAVETSNSSATLPTLSGEYNGTVQGSYDIEIYLGGNGLYYTVSGLSSKSAQPLSLGINLPLGNGLYMSYASSDSVTTGSYTIEVPNTKSSTYLTKLDAYNSALQTQTTQLASAQNAITTAQNNLTSAQLTYQQKIAPPASADVESARAQILNAQASLSSAQTAYSNNIIKAPFDGTIAAINVQAGTQAPSTAAATIIANDQIVTVSLNEVDAAKVQVGQKVNLTFDAVDGLNLTGKVAQIDTLGTTSQGVVSYNTKIALDSQDDRLKSGMSASATVIINAKPDVLAVPSSAVKTDSSGATYVQVLDNGKPKSVSVQVGIADDTNTEIISGLTEGQQVITQTITTTAGSTSKTSASTGSNSNLRLPGIGGAGGGNVRFIQGAGK